MSFFEWRRIRKRVRQMLREARHVRNLREDIAAQEDLKRLTDCEQSLSRSLEARDIKQIDTAGDQLSGAIHKVYPTPSYAALRENLEVIVVAVAVAMAFRTYFIQPFKIPTSSMHPTLYGIHYEPRERPELFDQLPLKLVKWIVLGEWYTEVHAQTDGVVQCMGIEDGVFRLNTALYVNGVAHPINDHMKAHVAPGDTVFRGQLLASGVKITGDHIFVNKVIWNFRKPVRGEVMVFKTDGINHPDIKKHEHYVKRMVGLPGETISINPPDVIINGRKVTESKGIQQVRNCLPGYNGYLVTGRPGTVLADSTQSFNLGPDQYFACGDNQRNSADSRYWGPVPHRNLMGPAFLVYWPFSHHWGLIPQ